ncbi:unnamed protein product [Nesidiocoris tenuis]|uniref:Peptidase S8 pro-domain domain-containing protein n=1 Tax=Nesidiocoris tenuis TaxID=355587 RepID=A0A6H5GUZ8_9HEMI|nr:unnamed protein product [Nesidiocoris tenuis]
MRRNSNKCSERMIPSILRCSASSDAMVKTLNLGNERLLREDFRNQVKSGCLRGNNQFQNKCEMIGSLDGYYVFEHPKLRKRSVNKHVGHHENLRQEPGIHPNQKLDVSLLRKNIPIIAMRNLHERQDFEFIPNLRLFSLQ